VARLGSRGSFGKSLGVTTMFDLRSDTEIAKYDAATPQIAGVTVCRAPVFAKEDYSPERELLSQFISVWALVDAFNSGVVPVRVVFFYL
jgi:hypothetical protein